MTEAFLRFRQLVFADDALLRRLQAEPDRAKFLDLVVELASQRACPLSREEAEAALRHGNRVWFERWL